MRRYVANAPVGALTPIAHRNSSMERDERMARFLNTEEISSELSRIIDSGDGRLLLISPFLRLNRRLREALELQDRKKRDIRIVYGKSDLHPEESEWLASTRIRPSFREHLHAKCYMNESRALITSMNLYEFSQQNNDEMGILLDRGDDTELYEAVKREAERILELSDELEPVDESEANGEPSTLPEMGFCLRCAEKVPFSLERPYCDKHYRSWAKFKNKDYEENYCHACGKDHKTSMAKPLCLKCYRKYRSKLSSAS